MEPITREEYYLAKIAGTYKGKTPEPVTNDEYYLATMAGDYSGNTPQPVTRLQYYMAKVAGVWDGSIPAPVTRLEYYWAAIASGEGKVFPPVTREEHFLVLVADAYSVVLTVVTGNPALLEGVKGNRFTSFNLYGISTQGSTTGANILKDTYLSLCKGGVDLFSANGLFTANSNYEKNVEFNLLFTEGSIFADSIKDEETYYIAFRPIGFTPVYRFQLSLKNGAHETIATSVGAIVASVSGAVLKKTARIQLYFFNVSGAIPIISGSRFQMIFSKKPDCIYEPYTGGKPSPSPEYPQEIKSAGDGGSVTVKVTGKNLFPVVTSANLSKINKPDGGVRYGYVFYVPVGSSVAASGNANVYTNCYVGDFDIKTQTYTQKALLVSEKGVANAITLQSGWYVIYAANDYLPSILIKLNGAKIQLEIGAEATAYEPYKPAQKLIIPTPNGLPGIPVSSGGNYTDEKGQQWVCDEVDFKKGVYVQRIAKYISSGGENLVAPSTRDGVDQYIISVKSGVDKNFINFGISNKFKCKNMFEANTFTVTDLFIYFRFAENTQTPETIREILNGCEFWYVLATPIETHLSSADLAVYSALRTYSPTTTVINDAGAGMSVGYAKMK